MKTNTGKKRKALARHEILRRRNKIEASHPLRTLRMALFLNQVDLGVEVGLSEKTAQKTVSQWERGIAIPGPRLLKIHQLATSRGFSWDETTGAVEPLRAKDLA